jgi:hypothetical protein
MKVSKWQWILQTCWKNKMDYFSTYSIFYFWCFHYIFDFICQSHWQATNKSKNNSALTDHVIIYSSGMAVSLFCWLSIFFPGLTQFEISILYFSSVVYFFGTHWATDYLTSRITSKYFGEKNFHMGFVIVGADQLIHFLTILIPLSIIL